MGQHQNHFIQKEKKIFTPYFTSACLIKSYWRKIAVVNLKFMHLDNKKSGGRPSAKSLN